MGEQLRREGLAVDFPTLLRNVQQRPGAYGLDGSYREFVAFVNGYDASRDWELLSGFREWLAERLGHGTNLVWWELVRQLCAVEPEGAVDDQTLCGRMFALLNEFLNRKEA
ncbi:hypothetical protein ABZ746_08350 [Streptomyces sp. NPDC020096]